MNKVRNKKENTKAKAIITVIATLLVCTLILGATTYFYKDEAYAFVKNIFGNEIVVEEPIIKEPIKELVYSSTPLSEGALIDNVYVNIYDFEKIVKENLAKSEYDCIWSIPFDVLYNYRAIPNIDADSYLNYGACFSFKFYVISFSSLSSNTYSVVSDELNDEDFFVTTEMYSHFNGDYLYSSSNVVLSDANNPDRNVTFSKGFNPLFIDSIGCINLDNYVSKFIPNLPEISISESKKIRLGNDLEMLILFGSTPFKAV